MTSSPRIWATLDPFLETGPTLGRRVANNTFLTALLSADPYDEYHFYLPDNTACAALLHDIHESFPTLVRRNTVQVHPRHTLIRHVAERPFHCMHLSDPISHFSDLMQVRNAFSQMLFPITGVTHTLSYTRYIPAFFHHLWPGVSAKDCLIATSRSACMVLERIYGRLRHEYRLPEDVYATPVIERIPLGVDRDSLPQPEERWHAPTGSAAQNLRRQWKCEADTVVFLSLARFSPHSKMDLMPLLTAMAEASTHGLDRQKVVLVLAGWSDEDDRLPEALQSLATRLGLRVVLCLRPSDETRRNLYAAADVFLSPSDNFQETFGLTVVEAGAAGLPVIASDFDGYRDTLVHGQTGMLIPTLGFSTSDQLDVLSSLWFDNQYLLLQAQQTVVDVSALAKAIASLGLDHARRVRMGEAARERVTSEFAWDTVISDYVTLWDRLATEKIEPAEEQRLRAARHPLRMRFAEYFGGHFTETLTTDIADAMVISRTSAGDALYRNQTSAPLYAGMDEVMDMTAVRKLLLAARKPLRAKQALQLLNDHFSLQPLPEGFNDSTTRERASCTLLWALKHHFLGAASE